MSVQIAPDFRFFRDELQAAVANQNLVEVSTGFGYYPEMGERAPASAIIKASLSHYGRHYYLTFLPEHRERVMAAIKTTRIRFSDESIFETVHGGQQDSNQDDRNCLRQVPRREPCTLHDGIPSGLMPMTPTRFRECLAVLDWTQRGLARQLDRPEGTVRQWARGTVQIPADVSAWLETRARHATKHPAPRRSPPHPIYQQTQPNQDALGDDG